MRTAVLAAFMLVLLSAGTALGAFPGEPPKHKPYPESQESPRTGPPNDEEFDPCEPADPQDNPDGGSCDSYFSEQFNLFGFRPESARNPAGGPLTYPNCAQLDAQGRDANTKTRPGEPACAQISGIRADSAWKFSLGDPRVVIAIFDNGIEWQNRDIVDKIHLNRRELPAPRTDGDALRDGVRCSRYGGRGHDRSGDGAFNVLDYACDPRVSIEDGDDEADELLDPSDLIARFSNRRDEDRNRYVDDIAGWDFFEDDNDPLDSSACCQGGHGTGRALDAAAQTNNVDGRAGVCPKCQIMPLRTADDIIHDTNLDGLATVYAANNGATVTECACGDLLNPRYARQAFSYADRKGLAQMMVSSDINSANHNYPTNYNEAIYVSGSIPDTAPTESCEIPGLPGVGGGASVPGCSQFVALLRAGGVPVGLPGQFPTTSFFRNPNLTQYGGKNDIVLVGNTGSENTGLAAGAAGLLQSYARRRLGGGRRVSGNEVRQLLTMTAEDVLPENTGTIGQPDRASPGWDTHFGYGRVNLAEAMRRIQVTRIPPEVQIDAPDFFAPLNVDKLGSVDVFGRVRARHFQGVSWKLEYACGQEPAEAAFQTLAEGSGNRSGKFGTLSEAQLRDLADNCDGSVANDAGRPGGRPGQVPPWPANPYPEPDPERHAFQIRLSAWQASDPGNRGQYRKTLFAHRDDGTLEGWPQPIGPGANRARLLTGSGGESSPRLADLDGDNKLDLLLATSSGKLQVFDGRGRPLRTWNHGKPVETQLYQQARAHGGGALGGGPPREPLRVPAIGDITGDGEPEVVVTAGERIYAWDRFGRRLRGFPQRVNPKFSASCKPGIKPPCFHPEDRLRTPDRYLKRGYVGSPALADLDENGTLDVVAGALDQHLYAYDGRGRALKGFPVRLDSGSEEDGAEIVVTPAIADLDGDDDPEVVVATNEVVDAENDGFDPRDLLSIFVGNATGANPTYAVHGDGTMVEGWPVQNGVLVGNILPLVLPSHPAAVADLDPSLGGDEVSISSATGQAKLVSGQGDVQRNYSNTPNAASQVADQSLELNLADYPSIGRLSDVGGPSVVKGGLTLAGAANLLATNQNILFNHTVQAWDPSTGAYRPGFPVATDDFQLLTEPAIARVAEGSERQALVGTGLYQLHAYGANGDEADGWPKFTGGWLVATPAVGDLDGDGELDVTVFTREGWVFAWGTGQPACESGGSPNNAEWWTYSHDEHSTANYGTDSRPPSRPRSVRAERTDDGAVRLSLRPSGDDLRCGEAARYEVVGSDRRIDSGARFVKAQELSVTQAQAGDRVELTVADARRFRHLAVRAVDDAGNVSYLKTVSPGNG